MTSSSAPSANAFVAKMLSICSVCPSRTGEALMQRILIGAPLSSTGGVGVSDNVIKSPLQHNTMQLSQPAGAVSVLCSSNVTLLAPSLDLAHLVEQCSFRDVLFFVLEDVQPDNEGTVVLYVRVAVSVLESRPNHGCLGQLAV